MGVYRETNIPRWLGILTLAAAFLILFEPWFLGIRELFRLEGFYAVQAAEFSPSSSIVTAHGVAIRNAYPLYPALTALLNRGFGLEMELALRRRRWSLSRRRANALRGRVSRRRRCFSGRT